MAKDKKKYAVIRIKTTQHLVSEGQEVLVDKLGEDKPEAEVLLVVDGEKVKIGRPVVKNVKVNLKVVEAEEKGKKITIQKYKAKSRYRKKYGFRPVYTKLLVGKITS